MRRVLLTLMLLGVGCAHAPDPVPVPSAPHAIDTPKLVVNPPPPTLYRFIGRVQGVARASDVATAARAANDDLRWKAHELGADVVRIDYVATPPEHGRAGGSVVLAGRAYRAIAHP